MLVYYCCFCYFAIFVSVAGCLGYDVLVFTSSVLSATVAFQLLVV